jgi:hypothetical protein
MSAAPKELYRVIEEKTTNVRGFMGSERGYDVSGGLGLGGAAGPRVLGQDDRGTKVGVSSFDRSSLFPWYLPAERYVDVRISSHPDAIFPRLSSFPPLHLA